MTVLLLIAAVAAAPDVFFVSVDTLRADRLGCYGCPLATSPAIDQLAAQGLLFEDCVCEVPLTAPSFGSMLSSQYPRNTGLTRNGLRMPDRIPLVAEAFRAAGYQTVCIQSNWTLKADLSGLDRGFDVYEDDFHRKRWGFIKSERRADEVTSVALKALKHRDPDKPLFMWVHYSDPHAPYKFHPSYSPRGRSRRGMDHHGRVRAAYDSEIAYTDHYIKNLLKRLPKNNRYILFVADHGESLYEHDYLGHGRRIYQTGIHIPLFIVGPGIEPGRSDVPARGVDIGPTLLGLADIEPMPGALGVNLLDHRPNPDRARVIETYGGAVPGIPGAKALMADDPPQYQGVLLDGWKLITNDDGAALYHINHDPMELKDLATEQPDRVEMLGQLIDEWDATQVRESGDEATLSGDDLRALESLGYLE